MGFYVQFGWVSLEGFFGPADKEGSCHPSRKQQTKALNFERGDRSFILLGL